MRTFEQLETRIEWVQAIAIDLLARMSEPIPKRLKKSIITWQEQYADLIREDRCWLCFSPNCLKPVNFYKFSPVLCNVCASKVEAHATNAY